MRKQLFTAFMLAAFSAVTSLSLDAQEAMDLIKENPGRAAGVYHNYEPKLNGETPAPKNFSPFYIS
ncbi:MAG: histidine-type phosphatase, partial [Bacteroidales bacterium]